MFELKMSGLGMNALGTEMMRFILAQLAAAGGEPVLVTGGGFAFSAGLDLRELLALDAPGTADFLALLERTTVALYTYPAPMVAHVNGHAIAGGCIVALCCDWRVARRQAPLKMGLNEVALGLRFPP